MSSRTIYDRKEFCEKIIDLIESSEETSAFILYSHTGVGKSSVCKKIETILNRDKNKNIIRIVSPQKNKNVQEGEFLKNIFKHIRYYYDKKCSNKSLENKGQYRKYRFARFLKKQKKFSTIIKCIFNNSDNFISAKDNPIYLILYGIKAILEYVLLKIGVLQNIDIETLNDNKLISDYIKYVLDSGNIILNIDNVQNFDEHSLNYFLDCIMETNDKNNFILLEYTLLEDNSNHKFLTKLEREFKNANIHISSLRLEYLDTNNVLKVAHDCCQNNDELFETVIKNNYRKLYNGNLKKVEHFASIYSEDISLDIDPTLEKIKKLSSKQQYILAIIIINNAVIKRKTLQYIIQNTSNDLLIDFETDIDPFCREKEFLEQYEDNIRIVHSSIIDVWYENIHIFKKYELLAYRNCQTIYKKILHNSLFHTLSKKECILLLFQLYSKFEINKISEMLFQIDEIIYDFLSVEELRKYLKKLIDSINELEEAIDLLYEIIEICIKFQLYDMQGYCLNKINNIKGNIFSEKYSLYQYIKMFQGEEYEELLELIKINRKKNVSIEFYSYSILFEIVANRALNNEKEYAYLVNQINTNSNFKKTIHYAYFLRLAEAYEKRNLAIPKIEESIKLFKKANLPLQVAKSQVSLAFLYAITGRINDAKKELELSEKILLKNIQNKYVFNINKACIHLLNGDFSDDIWTLLDEAEKCTQMRFDKIAIIINKLVLCIENSDCVRGNYLLNKGIELLEAETDKHIHAIFYYNSYVFYKTIGDKEQEQYFYNLAYKNKNYCETLKARLENKNEVNDGTTFLLSKPWHVCFVSYWYFDYLKDLK